MICISGKHTALSGTATTSQEPGCAAALVRLEGWWAV